MGLAPFVHVRYLSSHTYLYVAFALVPEAEFGVE